MQVLLMWTIQIAGIVCWQLEELAFLKAEDNAL